MSGWLRVCSLGDAIVQWFGLGMWGLVVYVAAGAVDRVLCRTIEYVVAGAVVLGPRSGVHCETAAYHVQAAA